MSARLLILLFAITAAIAVAKETRYFSPPSAILIPWLAREERHEKAGQLQDAISDYKEAIRLDPHSVLCWVGLARLFEETKQSDKAIAAYSSVLKFEPSNLPARFLRGQLYGRLGAHDKAMADATEVIRRYPNRAEGYSLRAGLYNVKNDYQKAIADANRAIQIDPRNISACTDAYFALGFAHLRLKAYQQAVLDLTAGLKLDPKDRTGLLHRSAAFVYLEKYKEAMADLQRADELDPKSTETLNRLAWMLATCPDSAVRNGRKATEYVNRLLRLAPDQWKFWDTRAAVFAENGDFGNAVQWEKRCLEGKDLSDAERGRVNERLALYRAGKPCREEPK